jgi:N-acetylmuramoyl-L-alanine amidase
LRKEQPMARNFIGTIRIRKRHLVALVAVVFLALFLARLVEERTYLQTIRTMAPAVEQRVVVVDAGHGGDDPGERGKGGIVEKDITLAVAKKLADHLTQGGAKVLMTRETDTDLSDPATVGAAAKMMESLQRRVALANDNQAELFLSIHVNSFSDKEKCGAQTYVQQGMKKSLLAGRFIQEALAGRLNNTKSDQPVEVDYYITKNTTMPAVVIEVGFLSNDAEARLLMDESYQERVAGAIYAGVLKYFAQEPLFQENSEREEIIETFKANTSKPLHP